MPLGPGVVDLSTQGTVRTANSDATIVSQIAASSAGDTVQIAAGTYGYITTTKAITTGFIRIVPAPGATVTCAGVDMTSAQGLDWRGINTVGTSTYNNWWQNSSRCRWRGGTHTMGSATRTAFTVRQGCTDIVVEDVTVNDAGISFIVQAFTEASRSTNIVFQRFRSNNVAQDHVFLSRGSDVVVQDFEMFGHTESAEHQDGVQIVGIKNATIRRGRIWNTRSFRDGAVDQNDHGVIVNYDDTETPEGRVPENIVLENLLIHDQTSQGISIAGVLGMTVRSCTVVDCGPSGSASALSIQPDTGNTISGLVIVNNVLSSWFSSGTIGYTTNSHNFVANATGPTGTNRLTGAPGFTNQAAQDYTLAAGSQNIGSGSVALAPVTDLGNAVRAVAASRGAIEPAPVTVGEDALRFNGSGDQLALATAPPTTTAITVTGWVRNQESIGFGTIMRLRAAGTIASFTASSGGTNGPQLSTTGGNAGPYVPGAGSALPVNAWRFVAFTVNGTGTNNAIVYHDVDTGGTLSTATGSVATGAPTALSVGGRGGGDTTERWGGDIAHPRLWTAPLTAADLQAERDSAAPVRVADLWAAWEPSNDGLTFVDVSGNNRHLTAGTTPVTMLDGPFVATPIVLVVDSARAVSRASRPVLAQSSDLTVDPARAVSRATDIVLAQSHPLTAEPARAATRAGTPLLAQHHPLVVDAARSTSRAQVVALAQSSDLRVGSARADTGATTPAVAQGSVVPVLGARAAARASAPLLGSDTDLGVHPARASTWATAPLLGQVHPLAVDPARSAARATVSLLGQVQPLAVAVARSATRATAPVLGQVQPLTLGSARSTARADLVTLTGPDTVTVRRARSATRATRPALTQHTALTVASARAAVRADTAVLDTTTDLVVSGVRAVSRAGLVVVEQHALLSVAGARAPTRTRAVRLLSGERPTPTPDRTLRVPAEPRITVVPAESRLVGVGPDPRALTL